MKKLLTSVIICCSFFLATAQTIKHHSYTVYYRPGLKEADSVSWDLTPEMMKCLNPNVREIDGNNFQADPSIETIGPDPKDYQVNKGKPKGLQIDKGHLYNAKDASCDGPFYTECYYMTNMLPQYHSFNTGDWKKLEIREQKLAKTKKLHIIAGGIGSIGHLPAGENIPKYMYKAIYMNGSWRVWIMLNDPTSKGHDIDELWETTVANLDTQTGLHL